MAIYELEWATDTGYEPGFRWVNQPEFYPVGDKSNAYLLGHDLLEHFDMLDYSVEAEIFSLGAMIRTRLEGNYFQHLQDYRLNEKPNEDFLSEGIESEVEALLDGWEPGDEFTHLGSSSQWMRRARNCRIQSKGINELIEESIVLSRVCGRFESFFETSHAVKLTEDVKSLVKLGYSMAKQRYKRYSPEQMALTFKSISKAAMITFDEYADFMYSGIRLSLQTFPSEGKTTITIPMEDMTRSGDLFFRKERVQAYYYDRA